MLIYYPVAELIEIPCTKRNVSAVISTLCTTNLVMTGVNLKIPFDDALSAMYKGNN
ncbi:L-serine ammonia-lyase, iron-sulfur-dependent, subunit alpha [Clostridium cagae]|uniref:L-serine ammonia-lyase, iron-sulfur-dependent, subunit alpha n=1 Tax=Clostridium TaxID=1485 RepID=UPI00338DF714